MTMRKWLFLILAVVLPGPLAAQNPLEGEYPGLETGKMWTFDVPPKEYWAARYGFSATDDWMTHVRLSALRYGNGCTASFVSGEGLVMTNHHCARACVEAVTRAGEDFLANGFYAATRDAERPCTGLFLDQLQEITDVTEQVTSAIPAKADAKAAAVERGKAIKGIEETCGKAEAGASCQVISMYRGGQYKLYRFHRYTDIRLVFAPEAQIAFFGGDPDNFTYPRFNLDMSFVRAYVDGKPADTKEHHFAWSKAGSSEGDLVFVIGNPGSTGRLNTLAQLEFLRDVQYPAQLDQLHRQIGAYKALAQADSTLGASLRNTIFGLENTQKAIGGYQSGLLDPSLMGRKKAWESEFLAKVNADKTLRAKYSPAWRSIADIRARFKTIDVRRRYYATAAYGSKLLGWAMGVVRYPMEMARPDSARLVPYREENKAAIEKTLFTTTPLDQETETALLAAYLTAMQKELPPTDPVLKQALQGRSPEDAAAAMVSANAISTSDQRKTLTDGGPTAIASSTDPFIALARVIDPLERAMIKEVTDLNEREAVANEQVARAFLAVYGSGASPDATFSLRISDGEVKRYPVNGTLAPAYTTFFGLYDRAASFGGVYPFNLPPRWEAARDSIDLALPFNAVSTADIIGGNSGSPVLNRDAQVVGLIFDGNIEMLPNRFLFTERVARSVWLDSRAIIEALKRVYRAPGLAAELQGSS